MGDIGAPGAAAAKAAPKQSIPKKRAAATPSSSDEGVDEATWVGVADDDELERATQLRVTVSKMTDKRGTKKRTRYQCFVTLHCASGEKIEDFKRFTYPLNDDPRSSHDAQQTLKQRAMTDFRKQKRARDEREGCSLVNSGSDERVVHPGVAHPEKEEGSRERGCASGGAGHGG